MIRVTCAPWYIGGDPRGWSDKLMIRQVCISSVGFGVVTEQSTGFPGYDSIIGPENATIGEILKENGYATSWFGKEHNTPSFQYSIAGPFNQWPVGMGFEYFYGFMGGETDQWTPYLFRNRPKETIAKPNLTFRGLLESR